MSSSTCVYVSDKTHGWLPANVLSSNETTAKVRVTTPALVEYGNDNTTTETEEAKEIELPVKEIEGLPLQNVDANGNMMEMEDMVDLPSLTEAAILANLMARHVKEMPYTKIGDIVIAMNPFKWLKDIYSEENRERYANTLVWDAKPGETPSKLPPHVYATSSSAFRGLAVDGVDQSILVSGESGAGKTETVKIVMSHLAAIQSSGSDGGSSEIVKRVLESNPLLEAFGNAKTVRNDNSSRFGKYIQLEFDVEDATAASFKGRTVPTCTLVGSRCETYLLEKSRIVGHEPEERGYHIFYQVLDSPKEYKASIWGELADLDVTSFKYVGHTDTTIIEGRTDGQTWKRTFDALGTVGIAGDTLTTLIRAVVIVMQLGNLTFGPDPTNDDNSIITSDDELVKLAGIMGVSSGDVKAALTVRTVVAGKEVYKVPLNATDAKDSCDAFAKEIYQQIFDWLVARINEATCAELNYTDASEVAEFGVVGLLDIFGFESFKINRFEQLCINYTNEKLQRKYTTDIFQSVQDEYEYEGIELCDLTYEDNSDVLNLIEGRMGLIAVLNEECVRPRGNDSAFVSKIKTMNKDVDCLIQEKLHRPTEFGINHYAGPVKYDASFFVKKNMDAIPQDLLECAGKCTNDLISTELKRAAEAKESSQQKSTGRSRKAAMTISTKFRGELTSLMNSVESTRTRYIRCIKPNKAKKPKIVNMTSAMEQLRCAGVVAAVSISRAAFPNRLTHEVALERFMCITDESDSFNEENKVEDDDRSGLRSKVEVVMSDLLKGQETVKDGEAVKAYVCGKTRIYFLSGALEYLESERLLALGDRSIVIQRFVRGFVARSKFLKLKDAAIDAQAFVRYAIARKAFVSLRAASLVLACWTRCTVAKAELLRRQRNKACTQIQLKWRRARDMDMLKSCISCAIIIQKMSRGAIQRPIYRAMLAQAAEDAKVENQLKILQRKLAEAEARRKEEKKRRIEAEKKIAAGAGAATIPQAAVVNDGEEKKSDGPTAEQQEALIHESGEMLEYMRKEIFNLRSKNYLLRSDLTQLKSDHTTLTETYQSTVANFEALNIHAHHISHENVLLATKVADLKKEMKVVKNESNVSRLLQKAEKKQFKEEQQKLRDDHVKDIERQKAEMERHARSQTVLNRYRQSYQQPTKSRVVSPVTQGNRRWYNDDDSTERSIERRSEKKKVAHALRRGSGNSHGSRQMPRVSSKLKIESSADVPEGTWDRKGFDELSKETPKNNRRRSRRGSQSNKSITPRSSRPGTPNSLSSSTTSPAVSSLAAASSLKRASGSRKSTRGGK